MGLELIDAWRNLGPTEAAASAPPAAKRPKVADAVVDEVATGAPAGGLDEAEAIAFRRLAKDNSAWLSKLNPLRLAGK
jgi:hypothetical protein